MLAAASAGCSKITEQNFEKINPDMSLEQVEAILGKGEITQDAGKDVNALAGINRAMPKEHQGKPVTVVKWKSGKNVIYVYFVGDKHERNVFKTASFP